MPQALLPTSNDVQHSTLILIHLTRTPDRTLNEYVRLRFEDSSVSSIDATLSLPQEEMLRLFREGGRHMLVSSWELLFIKAQMEMVLEKLRKAVLGLKTAGRQKQRWRQRVRHQAGGGGHRGGTNSQQVLLPVGTRPSGAAGDAAREGRQHHARGR